MFERLEVIRHAIGAKSADEVLMAIIIVIGMIILYFVMAYLNSKKIRTFTTLATSKIRSAAIGEVEIVGVVENKGEILTSPFSGKPCYAYSAVLYKKRPRKWFRTELQRKMDSGERWDMLFRQTKINPIIIRDDTGSMLVDAERAEKIDYNCYYNYRGIQWPIEGNNESIEFSKALARLELANDMPPHPDTSLVKIKYFFARLYRQPYKLTEKMLVAGDPVFVTGTLQPKPITAHDSYDKHISKGTTGHFIISFDDEKTIINKLRLEICAELFIGTTMTVVGLYMIFFI